MVDLLLEMLFISLAISSISMTITKSMAMKWLRNRVSKLGPWFKKLINCPYCCTHWLSFIIVGLVYFLEAYPLHTIILMPFGIVTISSIGSLLITWLFLALDELGEA